MRPILSVRDFARSVGSTAARLNEIAEEIQSHYRPFSKMDAKKQKVRHFRDPNPELKKIQKNISGLIARFAFSDIAPGGVTGKSPRSNATPHLGQRCVVNVDVKSFFPNVRHYVVYGLFRRELGFGRDVARLLTRLTTLDAGLPQGAPSSNAIANLLLTNVVDKPVSFVAAKMNAEATRFVDDFTFSGGEPRPLINATAKALSRRRLSIWRKNGKFQATPKLKITPNSQRQEVTGLVVKRRSGPSLSRERRDAVRAAIFQLVSIADASSRNKALESIRGRITHVRTYNPGTALRLEKYLTTCLGKNSAERLSASMVSGARLFGRNASKHDYQSEFGCWRSTLDWSPYTG
jgi:RNA-directed DNA polymerase